MAARPVPVLRLALGRSRILLCALIAAHAGAAAAVLSASPGWPWSAAASAVLAASAVKVIRRHALRTGPDAVLSLELGGAGECRMLRADGGVRTCRVQDSSYVSPQLVVLHLRESPRRMHYVVLTADSAPAEPLRRLRTRLRWLEPTTGEQAPRAPRL
jgi:toxin CptA